MLFFPGNSIKKESSRKRRKINRPKLLPNFLAFLLLFSPGNAQFGEIASVVTSLLAGGGGAGLAGLGSAAGSGASLGSLGSLGAGAASAGAGAAGAGNAIGNIGTLYQLAQAALQLTGTGVGIANQASESAWFPAVVESAAKMNRDFQDRLLHGTQGGGLGALGGLGGGGGTKGGKGSGSIGKEYGREFGSGEEAGETETNSLLGGLPSGPDAPFSSIFSSRVSLLPNLLPMGPLITPAPPLIGNGGIGGDRTRAGGIGTGGGLPGLSRLLPGESTAGEGESAIGGGIDGTIASRKKLIGIGTIEEVPLSPPQSGAIGFEGIGHPMEGAAPMPPSLLPGEGPTQPIPPASPPSAESSSSSSISSPKITVQLPPDSIEGTNGGNLEAGEGAKKKAGETTIEQIETEFSTDNEGGRGEGAQKEEGAEEEEGGLEPLIPLEGGPSPLNMTRIEQIAEHRGLAQMVPELRKLIGQLKMGNLTVGELEELEKQLAGNEGNGEPRENTERPKMHQGGRNSGEDENEERKPGEIVNEHRQRASNRNLAALRRGLYSSSELEERQKSTEEEQRREGEGDGLGGGHSEEKGEGEKVDALVDGQKDPILRKIVDFNRPPVILSLERPNPTPNNRHRHLPTLLGRQSSHRIESSGDIGQHRPHGAARAFGAPSEIIEEPKMESTSGSTSTPKIESTTEYSTLTSTISMTPTERERELGKSTKNAHLEENAPSGIVPSENAEMESKKTTKIVEIPPVVRAKVPDIMPSPSSQKYSTLNGQASKRKELPRTQTDQRRKHLNEQPLKLVDSAVEGNGRRPKNEIGRGGGGIQQAVIGPRGGSGGKRPAGTAQRGTTQQKQQRTGNWGEGGQRQTAQLNNNVGGQFGMNNQYGQRNQNWQLQQGNINGQLGTNWGTTFGGQFQQGPQPFYGQQNQQQQQQFFQQNGQQWAQNPLQQFPQNWANQQQNQQHFPQRTLPDPVQSTPPSVIYHPFSSGTLLTLGQSSQQQSQPEFFRFGRK